MKLYINNSTTMQLIWSLFGLSIVFSYKRLACIKRKGYGDELSSSSFQLNAKGRVDKPYDRDDENELAKIFGGNQVNQQRLNKPTNGKNPPPISNSNKSTPDLKSLSQIYSETFENKRQQSQHTSSTASGTSQNVSAGATKSKTLSAYIPSHVQLSPMTKPNNDWRTAKSDANPYKPLNYENKKPPKVYNNNDDDEYFSFTDLDYEDFEQAMREEENGDMNVKADKVSKPIVIHQGLHSGDTIPIALFNNNLLLPNGNKCELSKLVRPESDFLFIFSDPRRLSDDFRGIVKQFCMVPAGLLKVSMLAINCDDLSDQRKFIKKWNYGNGIPLSDGFPSLNLLTDPSKKVR